MGIEPTTSRVNSHTLCSYAMTGMCLIWLFKYCPIRTMITVENEFDKSSYLIIRYGVFISIGYSVFRFSLGNLFLFFSYLI